MWITTESGKHVNTDWFDKDRQIAANKVEADRRNDELSNYLGEPSKSNANRTIADRIEWINASDSTDSKNADRINNCQRCVISAELNARGYETTAMPKPKNDEFENDATWQKALGNPIKDSLTGDDFDDVNNKLNSLVDKLPENARGVISYQRKEIIKTGVHGHVIMMEKTANGPVFYDPQSGKIFKNFRHALTGYAEEAKIGEKRALQNAVVDFSRLYFLRTDNAKINVDMLKKYKVVNRF